MLFRRSMLAAAFWFSVTLLAGTALAQDETALPNGAGKESLQKVCTNCHTLDAVVGSRRTKAGWQRMVDEMADKGADGTEDEMTAIVAYLTTNFGKINVNTATAPEMEKALEFTPKESQAVVEYREKNGKIADFEQLKKVPGLSADKLTAKRLMIAFAQ